MRSACRIKRRSPERSGEAIPLFGMRRERLRGAAGLERLPGAGDGTAFDGSDIRLQSHHVDPNIDIFLARQNGRHGLRMDRRDFGVGVRRQEGEHVTGKLAPRTP